MLEDYKDVSDKYNKVPKAVNVQIIALTVCDQEVPWYDQYHHIMTYCGMICLKGLTASFSGITAMMPQTILLVLEAR